MEVRELFYLGKLVNVVWPVPPQGTSKASHPLGLHQAWLAWLPPALGEPPSGPPSDETTQNPRWASLTFCCLVNDCTT